MCNTKNINKLITITIFPMISMSSLRIIAARNCPSSEKYVALRINQVFMSLSSFDAGPYPYVAIFAGDYIRQSI